MCEALCPGVWTARSASDPTLTRLAVADRLAGVPDRLPRRYDERRAGDTAKLGAAGDIVVVDVRLEDVTERAAVLGEHREHAIDVPLRIDNHRPLPGDDGVAAIAQLRCLDRCDLGRHPATIPHGRAIEHG